MRLYDYAGSCNCFKVRLLLAQLGRAYDRVPIDIFAGETLTDEFAALNPLRSTPVLELDDGGVLRESGAILLYLASGTSLLPDDPYRQAEVASWLIYEQTDVVPMIGGLRFRLLTGRLNASDPAAKRRYAGGLEVLELLDRHLMDHEYFVGGSYSVADIALFGYVHRAPEAGFDLAPYAGVRAWLDRVIGQSGYMNDVEPYGANAAPGAGRSIYG
jgi:glutathione S-transferase